MQAAVHRQQRAVQHGLQTVLLRRYLRNKPHGTTTTRRRKRNTADEESGKEGQRVRRRCTAEKPGALLHCTTHLIEKFHASAGILLTLDAFLAVLGCGRQFTGGKLR